MSHFKNPIYWLLQLHEMFRTFVIVVVFWNLLLILFFQAHLSGLQRKYEQAKKIIHELKRHEQFLAVQLQVY